jgi:hypothetical protein
MKLYTGQAFVYDYGELDITINTKQCLGYEPQTK